jgi:GNAT superfamily N-acetyltransferase
VGEGLALATVAALLLGLYVWVYYRRQLMRRLDRLLGPAFHDLDRDLDDELLDSFHRAVLADSFDSDELEDVEELARGLRGDGDPKVLASVAVGRDGSVLGGVVGEVYAPERVLLLAYLAVRRDLRGGGIGRRLMQHVKRHWYVHPDVRLAVAEVHDPRHWSVREGDAARRRLGLFERLGARVLEVPFVQPSLGRGRPRVPGFFLLAFHVDPSIEVEQNGYRAIPSDLVGGFVRRYFESAEEISAPYDAQLSALLARIEENPRIRLLPIAEYDQVPPLE